MSEIKGNSRLSKEALDQYLSHIIGKDDTFCFDCKMCGSCCRKRSEPIVITGTDIFFIAKALEITPLDVTKDYVNWNVGPDSRLPIATLRERLDGSCVLMRKSKCMVQSMKKVRRFGKRDPKVQVPGWCPRRISPPVLRIYDFRSANDWACQTILKLSPLAHRYCVTFEGTIELSAKAFWNQCSKDRYGSQLPIPVPLSGIVEIDDGIQPVCFYHTDRGYELLEGFDTAAARANQRREEAER